MRGMGEPSYRLMTANENCMHVEKLKTFAAATTRISLSKLTKTIFNVEIVALPKRVTNYGSMSGFLYFSPTAPIETAHTICNLETYTVQPLHCMFSHLLNSIVIFIPCTYMI